MIFHDSPVRVTRLTGLQTEIEKPRRNFCREGGGVEVVHPLLKWTFSPLSLSLSLPLYFSTIVLWNDGSRKCQGEARTIGLAIEFPAKACPVSFNRLTPATRRIHSSGVPRRRRFHLTRQPVGAFRFSKADGDQLVDARSTVPPSSRDGYFFPFLISFKLVPRHNKYKYSRNYVIHTSERCFPEHRDISHTRERKVWEQNWNFGRGLGKISLLCWKIWSLGWESTKDILILFTRLCKMRGKRLN